MLATTTTDATNRNTTNNTDTTSCTGGTNAIDDQNIGNRHICHALPMTNNNTNTIVINGNDIVMSACNTIC